MRILRSTYGLLLVILGAFVLSGCTVNYSFTGGSIHPDVKTINIKNFPNNANLVEPTLSQKLTDALRDKFVSDTRLVLVSDGGDAVLEGSITGYRTQPVAIQGDDQAALNRLTITLDVKYTNIIEEDMSFESSFSRYADYSSDQNLSDVQELLIDEINEMLVEDVFNKAVINW